MNLKETHPELCETEWHYEKNRDDLGLFPEDVTYGMRKKVWWKCPKTCQNGCQHVYPMEISNKIGKKYGCTWPGCNRTPRHFCFHESLAGKFPQICEEWNYEKNKGLKDAYGILRERPEQNLSTANISVWWKCKKICLCGKNHEWRTEIYNRTKDGKNCRYCCGYYHTPHCYQTSFAGIYKNLAEEWCNDKNIIENDRLAEWLNKKIGDEMTPGDFTPKSNEEVWWECYNVFECGCSHIWRTGICDRANGDNCPYCCFPPQKICKHNSLKYLRPDLMKEWDFETNNKKDFHPEKLSLHSRDEVYWICAKNKNHKWITSIDHRTRKNNATGCPFCKHKTESKLLDWFIKTFPDIEIKSQIKFGWCKNTETNSYLPFDFVIEEHKLIIELDGPQHFKQVSNWKSHELTQKIDKYKMKCANENNYTVIRLLQEDVLDDLNDWDSKLKNAIKKYDIPQKIYICSNDEYDCYIT